MMKSENGAVEALRGVPGSGEGVSSTPTSETPSAASEREESAFRRRPAPVTADDYRALSLEYNLRDQSLGYDKPRCSGARKRKRTEVVGVGRFQVALDDPEEVDFDV